MTNRDFWKEWNRGKHYGVGAKKLAESLEQVEVGEQMPRELWEALRVYKEYYHGLGFVEGINFSVESKEQPNV